MVIMNRLNEKAPESNLQRASCLAKKFGKHIKTRQNKHPHAEQRHAASRMLYSVGNLIHRRILRIVSMCRQSVRFCVIVHGQLEVCVRTLQTVLTHNTGSCCRQHSGFECPTTCYRDALKRAFA